MTTDLNYEQIIKEKDKAIARLIHLNQHLIDQLFDARKKIKKEMIK